MSTKKRVLINIGLTLCLFGLVTLKLIRWHTHYMDFDIGSVLSELKAFTREPMYFFLIVPKYGIFLSAFFALVTIWLPAKAKAMFGMIALRISVAMGIFELGAYLFIHILVLLSNKSFPYIGLDPLLTAGVIAVIYFAAATSDGFDIVKSKKNENKSQWIFFSHKEKTISAKRKQWGVTSKSRTDIHGNRRCYRRQEVQDQKPTQGNKKTIIAKIGRLLLAAAVIVFALCTVLVASDAAVGSFFVLMPIAGICLLCGVILRVVDHMRKQ